MMRPLNRKETDVGTAAPGSSTMTQIGEWNAESLAHTDLLRCQEDGTASPIQQGRSAFLERRVALVGLE